MPLDDKISGNKYFKFSKSSNNYPSSLFSEADNNIMIMLSESKYQKEYIDKKGNNLPQPDMK